MSTSEPELSPDVANAKGLRTGWTTGTCASAAAKAATLGLISGVVPASVDVALPHGQRVTFPTIDAKVGLSTSAAIKKDAGDDPDCTDGAHITATVRWADGTEPDRSDEDGATLRTAKRRTPTVTLKGGDGVGTVTLPGLGLEVGSPAINPVPRAMITAAIAEVTTRDVVCTITVPRGQEMAKKTSNERLGIVGGISILGTTGIVKPFSTASYRASVVQQVEVAAAQGQQKIVLCTGSRSDMWAQNHFDDLDQVCFVEVGDFTGIALRKAWSHEMPHLVFVGMAGKIAKLAAGVMMTHFHRSKVDIELLKSVALESGASDGIVAAATETNTARHFAERCMASDEVEPLRRLCVRAAKNCRSHIGADSDDFDADSVTVEVIMVDFSGTSEVCRGR